MIESRAEWEREESKGERERWGGGGKRERGWGVEGDCNRSRRERDTEVRGGGGVSMINRE